MFRGGDHSGSKNEMEVKSLKQRTSFFTRRRLIAKYWTELINGDGRCGSKGDWRGDSGRWRCRREEAMAMGGDRRRATMEMTDDGWPWRREEATAMEGNGRQWMETVGGGWRATDDDDDNGDRMDDDGLCLVDDWD